MNVKDRLHLVVDHRIEPSSLFLPPVVTLALTANMC